MELKSKMPELDESTLLKLEVCSSVSIFKEMIPRFIGYFIHVGNDIVFKYRSFFSVIELLQARYYFYEVTTSANINDRIRRYISY